MHPNVEYCKHVDNYSQGFAILEKDAGKTALAFGDDYINQFLDVDLVYGYMFYTLY